MIHILIEGIQTPYIAFDFADEKATSTFFQRCMAEHPSINFDLVGPCTIILARDVLSTLNHLFEETPPRQAHPVHPMSDRTPEEAARMRGWYAGKDAKSKKEFLESYDTMLENLEREVKDAQEKADKDALVKDPTKEHLAWLAYRKEQADFLREHPDFECWVTTLIYTVTQVTRLQRPDLSRQRSMSPQDAYTRVFVEKDEECRRELEYWVTKRAASLSKGPVRARGERIVAQIGYWAEQAQKRK